MRSTYRLVKNMRCTDRNMRSTDRLVKKLEKHGYISKKMCEAQTDKKKI